MLQNKLFLKTEPRKPSFRFLNFEVGSVFRKPISKIFIGFRAPLKCLVWSMNGNHTHVSHLFIKPPPPIGAGGGYMFSGHPSVPLSVRASVHLSVIHVVVLCFRDISSICLRIFAKLLSLVHLGTQMT